MTQFNALGAYTDPKQLDLAISFYRAYSFFSGFSAMRNAILTRCLLPFAVSSVCLVHFHLPHVGLHAPDNWRLCVPVRHTRLGVPLPGPPCLHWYGLLAKNWRRVRWVSI